MKTIKILVSFYKVLAFLKKIQIMFFVLIILNFGCYLHIQKPIPLDKLTFNKKKYMQEFRKKIENNKYKMEHICNSSMKIVENELNVLLKLIIKSEKLMKLSKSFFLKKRVFEILSVIGNYKKRFSYASKAKLVIDKENNIPAAFAYNDNVLEPRIIISKGLIKALCKEYELKTNYNDLIKEVESKINKLPKKFDMTTASTILDIETKFSQIFLSNDQKNLKYNLCLLFVISHEFGHLIFDRNEKTILSDEEKKNVFEFFGYLPNQIQEKQISGMLSELRADLYGIFINEYIYPIVLSQRIKQREFKKNLRVNYTYNEYMKNSAKPGFNEFLSVIYKNIELRKGDLVHLPVESRIKLLNIFYKKLKK